MAKKFAWMLVYSSTLFSLLSFLAIPFYDIDFKDEAFVGFLIFAALGIGVCLTWLHVARR